MGEEAFDNMSAEDRRRKAAAMMAGLSGGDANLFQQMQANRNAMFDDVPFFGPSEGMQRELENRMANIKLDGKVENGKLLPIKEVIPGMIKRKFGRIVCISSIAGLGKRPNMITYATSKASVIALARNLAEAVAPYIRINTVAPGLIETDMAKAFSKEAKKNIILNTPLKRLGTSEDIANTVIYLLSEQSSFITGQTLIVDGGKVVLP